jgi:hypothetical protein
VEHSLLLVIEARPKAIVISKRNAHVTAGISTSLSYDNKKIGRISMTGNDKAKRYMFSIFLYL